MLRDQHEGEGRVKQALTQQELLLSRLKQSEGNFSNQMRENELLDADLRSAKNTLKSVDRQFESNSASINRLELQVCPEWSPVALIYCLVVMLLACTIAE